MPYGDSDTAYGEIGDQQGGSGTGDLKADGTVPLTANWDVGAYTITALRFVSDQATGTAPFTVTSTTVVTNLNADQLDGNEAAAFMLLSGGTMTGNIDLDGNDLVIDADGDTYLHETADDIVTFVLGSDNSGQIILPLYNDAVTPTLAFSDGDTGIYEISDDVLGFAIAGSLGWRLDATDFRPNGVNGPKLMRQSTSATNPVVCIHKDYETFGMGGDPASNYVSLIANSLEKLRVDTSSTAGDTALLIYDVDNNSVDRVTVGAADSGGAGYKVLRIPN